MEEEGQANSATEESNLLKPQDEPTCQLPRTTDALFCQESLSVAGEVPPATPQPPTFLPWGTSSAYKEGEQTHVRIYIDGNIGAGKTIVMAFLAQQLPCADWHIVLGPVQDWHELLRPFYGAPMLSEARHCIAALLQLAVLNAYVNNTPSLDAAPKVIMERGSWSSHEVFLQVQGLPANLRQLVLDMAGHMDIARRKQGQQLSSIWTPHQKCA